MMIILRIFLYLICIASLGWSILVFGGPPILRLISGYSDGAFIASSIRVTPALDISIGRLDFIFQNETTTTSIDGFSRAIEIEWSISDDKPFLEIDLGPSVFKEYAAADRINIQIPSYKEIDWQNIILDLKIYGLIWFLLQVSSL